MPIEIETERARDLDWLEREQRRFRSGEYRPCPWVNESWWYREPDNTEWDRYNRLTHISVNDPSMVAFTASEEHGQLDRQTRMKPGKYLKRFYGHILSDREIADWAALFTADAKPRAIYWAETADAIEDVYVNGPSSCMSRAARSYDSSIHPVRVYAAGDLVLAYITRNNLPVEQGGEPTARVLCWPELRVYGRIYGDAVRLRPLLEDLGYIGGDLDGARLLRIEENDGRLVCPYIDGAQSVTDWGDYLKIGGDEIEANSTTGLIGDAGYYCQHCGGHVDEEATYYIEDRAENWCRFCYEGAAWTCEISGEVYSDDVDRLDLAAGGYAHPLYSDYFWQCGHSGDYHRWDDEEPLRAIGPYDGEEIRISEAAASAQFFDGVSWVPMYLEREDEEGPVWVHRRYIFIWDEAHSATDDEPATVAA